MSHARQQYQADGSYVDKQLKEFSLTQEIIEKIDSIEPSAERNAIQWVKVNGQIQIPDQYRVVDLTIPEVVDNLDSYDNKSSLSARQGRVLAQQIKNLQSIWKFLSNWNSTTGLPTSNPSTIPYIYKPWDYYIVSIVGSANYRPEWTSFDWSSSSTLETELVDVWDIYMYDDEWWLLLHNSARVIAVDTSLSTSSTNPVENRVVTQALNTKQEKIVAGANIQIAQDWKTISATDTTYDNLPAAQGWTADSLVTTGDKYNWDNKQKALTAWANIQIAQDGTISATDTVYWAWTNIQINWNIISATDTTYVAWDFDIKDLADSTGLRTEWSWKQDELIAWTNIQIAADWKTISATDTTYTAGTWIDITNWVISNTQTSAEWWNITWTLSSQTDLQNALDWKLDKVISTATNPRAYVVNADWSQATLPITDSATSGAIVRRNWTQITVPATPSADTDAASKKYVDDQVSAATTGAVSDTSYSSAWDWVTGIAPSKNAVYDKISAMDTTISWHTSSISTINWKIPAEATSSNQLADKAFVGDSINSVAAYYITKNANWDQFATKAELNSATTFYSGWVVRVPTKNDYTIVLSDETKDNATTRYIYNNGWEYQYTVNETPLTQAQLNAINSWITSSKVSTYDWYATTIASKANDNAVVHTTWAETINGTKTFWTSPVVPNKTADAGNTWTAIATEAQVYKKADASDVLTKTNTTSFTPSWDYNPATKKYVDDSVSWKEWTLTEITKSDMDTGTSTTAWKVAAKSIADYVKWKVSNVYVYKGSKANYDALPSSWNATWDVWNVEAAHTTAPIFPAWSNVAWDWSAWDVLGWTVDLSWYQTTANLKTSLTDNSDTYYPSQKAVKTAVDTKANDSDVVKLTWNQTIAWTKTFSTSPVVPSKTSAATNSWTKIATEAQVYKKQDKLTTQTAYTSKWTSTKVPTITTNTLWQVTGITETSIAFPVTSVWGSTGAVWLKTINWNSIVGTGDITVSWWISLDANSPITVSKLRVGTEAQYSALGSYDASTVYMTV